MFEKPCSLREIKNKREAQKSFSKRNKRAPHKNSKQQLGARYFNS